MRQATPERQGVRPRRTNRQPRESPMKTLKHRPAKFGLGLTSTLLLACAAYLPQYGTSIALYHESIRFVWVDIPPLYVYIELVLVVLNLPAAAVAYALASVVRDAWTFDPKASFLMLAGSFTVLAVCQWVAVDWVIGQFRQRRSPG